jgi:hypothetical protein
MDTDPAHHDINSPTNQSLAYLRECSLGRHGPGAVTAVPVTAVTAAIVGIRMARAVTAVTIVPAVTAVARRAFVDRGDRATVGTVTAKTGRAFVTRPEGGMGDRGRRDRRDRGSSVPVGIAMAAMTAVIAELRPVRDVPPLGPGVRAFVVNLDRVIAVSGTHFAPRPEVAAALNQNVQWPRATLGRGEPRRSRRQDRALEAAGDRNNKCF